MMKEDSGVSRAQAWGCPHTSPRNIQGDSSISAWGCPRASPSPSTIISSSLVSLYFYRFMRYVLFLERLALRFCFYLSLALLAVNNKLEPSFLCVGEKHAPLSKFRTQHRSFHAYLCCVCSLSFHSYFHVFLIVFMLIFSKSFCLVCCWNSLEFACLSCLESLPVALSFVSQLEVGN